VAGTCMAPCAVGHRRLGNQVWCGR
jgi:hypothetical protein